MRGPLIAVGVALATLLPPAAIAQVGPALDPGVMVGFAGGAANQYSLQRNNAPRSAASSVTLPPRLSALDRRAFTAQRAATRVAAPTRYQPSATATQRNMRQFVARTRAADPQAGADLERSLRGGALVTEARAALAGYGLDGNDLADATAAYLVTAWYGAQGSDRDPTKAMLRSVSNQLAAAMAATPAFGQASDAQKQELAEAMIIHTIYIGAALEETGGDAPRRRQVVDAIAAGARNTFGFGMTSVSIDDQGVKLIG